MAPLARTIDSAPRTVDEFLDLYEGVEGPREFVDGEVIEMIDVTFAHHVTATLFASALRARLGDRFFVATADFGISIDDGLRHPDIMVLPFDIEPKATRTARPLLLGEVLSEESRERDLREKRDEYLTLPSLPHYVVLEQDAPSVKVWSRDRDGAFGDPAVVTGAGTIVLEGVGASVPLSEIYR